jgi:hypothetical protein
MTDASVADAWKPDRSRIVLSIFPGDGFLYAQVDPGSPKASGAARLVPPLRRPCEEGPSLRTSPRSALFGGSSR